MNVGNYRLIICTSADPLPGVRELETFDCSPYDAASLFLAVVDARGAVLGAARLIVPGPAGLKSVNDARRGDQAIRMIGLDPSATWDLASFAVRADADARVAAILCHGVVEALRVNRVRSVVATLDARSRHALAAFGLLPGRLPGGAETARWAHLSELLDVQRRTNPDGYRLVSLGLGLEAVDVPTADELLVSTPVRAGLAWAAVRQLMPSA